MRWLGDEFLPVFLWLLMTAGAAVLIVTGIFAAFGNDAETPLEPPPIGYTLYDVTNNRIIDIQPCPHPWGQFPTFQSFDQWMPNFGRKYDFGNGFSTLGGVFLELRPKGYVAPAECGQAYD